MRGGGMALDRVRVRRERPTTLAWAVALCVTMLLVYVLTLDVGTSSGVEVNMPVVTSDGVVGRITEVGLNWSRV